MRVPSLKTPRSSNLVVFLNGSWHDIAEAVCPLAVKLLEDLLVFVLKNPALADLVRFRLRILRCEFTDDLAKVNTRVVKLDARSPLASQPVGYVLVHGVPAGFRQPCVRRRLSQLVCHTGLDIIRLAFEPALTRLPTIKPVVDDNDLRVRVVNAGKLIAGWCLQAEVFESLL